MARSPAVLAPLGRTARRARRSLALRWIVVAAAAAVAAAQAAAAARQADAARAAWGDTVEVVVAARDLPAGRRLAAADVRVEARPVAVVPVQAVGALPAGATLRAEVVAGEVLVDSRLAPAGVSGVAALVPAGWRAVAVPTSGAGFGSPAPPLRVGDRVDLLAPEPVASDAVVVAVTDDAVTVAVPARDAPAVAEAAGTVPVTIALRGR